MAAMKNVISRRKESATTVPPGEYTHSVCPAYNIHKLLR